MPLALAFWRQASEDVACEVAHLCRPEGKLQLAKAIHLAAMERRWGDGMEGIFELCCVAAFFPFTCIGKKQFLRQKRLGQEFHSGRKIANSRRFGDDSETLVHMGAHIAYILKLCQKKANPQKHFGRNSMTDKQYYKRCQSCWVQGRVVRLGRELGAAGELQYMHVVLNCVDIMRFGWNVYRRQ